MKPDINPKLKPLYANLLRLSIGKYLISSQFDHLMLEHNLDKLWESCEQFIRDQSNVIILVPGYSGDATSALGIFLNEIFRQASITDFFDIIMLILTDFSRWEKTQIDFTQVIESLKNLGFESSKIEEFFESVKPEIGLPLKQLSDFKPILDIKVDMKLCFIIMPFEEKFNSIYSNVLKPTVETKFKLKCMRADEIFGTKPIMEDIWEHIKKANFLIADLTGRNPNVFYELGIAHALDKKVILLTQDINDVPFDLKHFRCIVYQDSISGSDKLKEGLGKTLSTILK